jgi:hypothetical protein
VRSKWVAIGIAGLAAILVTVVALAVRPFDTPERQVDAYLAATAAGDETRALDAWKVFAGGIHPLPVLLARRTDLTRELAAKRVGTTHTIRSIEWWRTCCEPGPIDGSGNAGLARVHVSATDPSGGSYDLVFEVFVKTLNWSGDAGGGTVRDWTLYEVHREADPCVFPSSAYGCAR